MRYYSTNNKTHFVSLREAVINGLAPDNGLYMSEYIPAFDKKFLSGLKSQSFKEVALAVASAFMKGDIPTAQLQKIIDHTLTFDAPLKQVDKKTFALELFHGPTLAFKDFGARFMSQVLGYFAEQEKREITILVATSGDTGSAVANGFLNVPGTRVIVLYPSGKVSDIQEKQFTTLGGNIIALEIDGTFDDCQRLVKSAFLDRELKDNFFLTSANSINISRLIPQMFYYFRAWSQLPEGNLVFSVPSGNFGNLTAGLMAKKMGLENLHFVASTNVNDIVPEYLMTRIFTPRPSITTISNAMDVGNPSNFPRMLELVENDFQQFKKEITGYAFTDSQTQEAIKRIYSKSNYLLDPHGAVGYLGMEKYRESVTEDFTGVFLETAHPAKFKEVVESAIGQEIAIPDPLKIFLSQTKKSIPLSAKFSELKDFIKSILHEDRD